MTILHCSILWWRIRETTRTMMKLFQSWKSSRTWRTTLKRYWNKAGPHVCFHLLFLTFCISRYSLSRCCNKMFTLAICRSFKVHLHWVKANAKAKFCFEICRCSVWTLNWILGEPIWKRCNFRFRPIYTGSCLQRAPGYKQISLHQNN